MIQSEAFFFFNKYISNMVVYNGQPSLLYNNVEKWVMVKYKVIITLNKPSI